MHPKETFFFSVKSCERRANQFCKLNSKHTVDDFGNKFIT